MTPRILVLDRGMADEASVLNITREADHFYEVLTCVAALVRSRVLYLLRLPRCVFLFAHFTSGQSGHNHFLRLSFEQLLYCFAEATLKAKLSIVRY